MTTTTFFIPPVNMMGAGCLVEAIQAIRSYGFRHALIVTDAGLSRAGVALKVAGLLAEQDIQSTIFDGAQPNPTVGNVEA
ncbi:MAG TPA: L-threonine dehydrogenase, partial [Oxalobacteraceae bacterium]|nr:L-threonine dehydrogenase [Oxalobacteraceae bacterium]